MKRLNSIQLPAGPSCAEFDVSDLNAPLFIAFDHASTATLYLDGAYLGAVVSLGPGGAVFFAVGKQLMIYRTEDQETTLCVGGN